MKTVLILFLTTILSQAAVMWGTHNDVYVTFETENNYDGKLTVVNQSDLTIEMDSNSNPPPWVAGYSLAQTNFSVSSGEIKEFVIYYWGLPENLVISWDQGSTSLQVGTMPIPEPSVALLGLAGMSLLAIRRGRAMRVINFEPQESHGKN